MPKGGAYIAAMNGHTPPMNRYLLEHYLRRHLANEIRCLLPAAAEWDAQKTMELNEAGYEVQVYAMDSAFVHARNLFEFFTEKTTEFHYGFDAYAVEKVQSKLYQKHWKSPLHSHLMHAQDRTATDRLPSFKESDQPKPLQDMPVDFAREVVRLWRGFAEALQQLQNPELAALGGIADTVLTKAIDASQNVLRNKFTQGYKLRMIVW
jgi:hypothetical protein